jgi:hypothetical protein
MQLIESKTLGTAAASIEFTSIPQDGTDLVAFISVRSSGAAGGVVTQLNVQFNGVGGTAYSDRQLEGSGSAATSGSRTGQSVIRISCAPNSAATANTFSSALMYIPNYSGSNAKSVSFDGASENNATEAYAQIVAGLSTNTTAITSLTFTLQDTGNLVVGSTISLYKITKGSDGIVTTS